VSNKKREERKQRSEEHREQQERLKRQKQLRSRVMFVFGVLVLVVAGYFATRRKDGMEKDGKVWSAAHGHWHDK
jgi:uncharacterized membrane protein